MISSLWVTRRSLQSPSSFTSTFPNRCRSAIKPRDLGGVFEVGEKYLPRFPEKPRQDSARPPFISGRDGRSDRSDARGVTAVTQGDGGEACGEMKDGVNLRAAAFHSWICARLNFPRGGRQEAAGPSVTL